MKAFNVIVWIIVAIFAVLALGIFIFQPMFHILGVLPVILCIGAILLCMALGFAFKGTKSGAFFGYLCCALTLGIVLYFAIQPATPSGIWQIVIIDVAVVLGIFFTNILKDLPFLEKLIPFIWLLIGIGVFAIFFK